MIIAVKNIKRYKTVQGKITVQYQNIPGENG
jgi:hypothetical protein